MIRRSAEKNRGFRQQVASWASRKTRAERRAGRQLRDDRRHLDDSGRSRYGEDLHSAPHALPDRESIRSGE